MRRSAPARSLGAILHLAVALLAVAPGACSKRNVGDGSGDAGAPASSASAAAKKGAGARTVTATLEGQPLTFKTAWVVAATQYAWLFLSTGDTPCSEQTEGVTRLQLDLHAGPGDALFAGHPIAVPISIDPFLDHKRFHETWVGSPFVELSVAPLGKWTKGAHLTGTLEFAYRSRFEDTVAEYRGKGGFDAVICDEKSDAWWKGTPADAPSSAVTGSWDKEAFTARTALAIVMHDDLSGVDTIDTVKLFPVADVTCEGRAAQEKAAAYFQLAGPVPGANSRQKITGTAQPSAFYYYTPSSKPDGWPESHAIGGDGWVRLDALDTKVGGRVRGALRVDAAAFDGAGPARFAGTFDAEVCRW